MKRLILSLFVVLLGATSAMGQDIIIIRGVAGSDISDGAKILLWRVDG